MKSASVTHHCDWVLDGKSKDPNNTFYINMQRSMLQYKQLIRRKEMEGKEQFSNELHDALVGKENDVFWKCWKSKFKKAGNSQVIAGSCSPGIIASKFATAFSSEFEIVQLMQIRIRLHLSLVLLIMFLQTRLNP